MFIHRVRGSLQFCDILVEVFEVFVACQGNGEDAVYQD
jgi:hypothetical protein